MRDDNFDYKSFSLEIKKQAHLLIPKDISIDDGTFICNIIEQFVEIAGKRLSMESSFSVEKQRDCCQIIAEWTFHKSVDMIRANIPKEYWEAILQSIAFVVYEVVTKGYERNIENDELLQAVEYHVRKGFKYKLDELYAKNCIDKIIYTEALAKSNIDEMNKEENHSDCYSLENSDYEFLNDSVTIAFAQNLAYRYLIKAAHCLKKASMQTNDRKKILSLLRVAILIIINHIQTSDFKFSIPQIERIITVSMELLFHRIVVMYRNNTLIFLSRRQNDYKIRSYKYYAFLYWAISIKFLRGNKKLFYNSSRKDFRR